MVDGVRRVVLKYVPKIPPQGNVGFLEVGAGWDIVPIPTAQVIQTQYGIPAGHQCFGDVGTDKPGAPGYYRPSLFLCSGFHAVIALAFSSRFFLSMYAWRRAIFRMYTCNRACSLASSERMYLRISCTAVSFFNPRCPGSFRTSVFQSGKRHPKKLWSCSWCRKLAWGARLG